ncbi:MAG: hypothetical protein HZA89_18110 [Verrucomicrobia bacterium]|nr:hypothetical protein [Verrucomicrobiota bacterium]
MKIPGHNAARSGSVLMITVVATAVMAIMLVAYLNLTNAQTTAVSRSQSWNSAIPVLEYGLEEALAHLNQNGTTNLDADGWYQSGNQYLKWRQVSNSWTFVNISNAAAPVIYAYGFTRIPYKSQYLQRAVRVTTTRLGYFRKGILSQGQITLNGTGYIDSYDSTDTNYSTGGFYDPSKRKAGGGVASNAGLTNILATGNTYVYGDLATGPGGSVSIGPNGKVGDLAWIANLGTSGIQPGKVRDDMNVGFPDVALPFGSGTLPAGGGGYQYILDSSGNWQIPSLTGSLLVRSNVNAVLVVNGNINLTGNDAVVIQTGGSLNLYMNGTTAKIGGNGVVNSNAYTTNFMYWGRPGNTELTVSGNGSFVGVVYAPQASFTLNGGGNSDIEAFNGAVVANTARLNGNFSFHYDESLAKRTDGNRFTATSWDEF